MLFRVLLRRTAAGQWRALAFMVPNDGSVGRNAGDYAVPVTQVEAAAGLRFFPEFTGDAATLKSSRSVDAFMEK
jgi:DNA/RNA endonuclease G (NUC1)